MDINKAKDTIRKLLNLANDSGASQGEIDNAMRFAAKLLEQHQLSEEDLGAVDEKLMDLERKACTRAGATTGGSKVTEFEYNLAHFVCKLVGGVKYHTGKSVPWRENGVVKLLRNGDVWTRGQFIFYGIEEDVQIATELFAECLLTICTMAKLKWGGVYRGPGRSYCEGFVTSLLMQLDIDQQKQLKASTGTAFMVIESRKEIVAKKLEIAKAFLATTGVRLRKNTYSGGGKGFDSDAYQEGRSDGERYNPSAERRKKLSNG